MRPFLFCSLFAIFLSPNCTHADVQKDKKLFEAVQFQDLVQIKALIAGGANANAVENGRPILGWAAQNGNVAVVDALLAAGADPNRSDIAVGHTPLMRAIDTQHVEVVKALLKGKANPSFVSKGKSCLMMAAESRKPEIVQSLVDAGADTKFVNEEGYSPALLAAQDGFAESLEIIRILGRAKANLDASNAAYTPLIYAVQQENKSLIQALLDAGANPDAPSAGGQLPIFAAIANPEIVEQLLKAKADPNILDSYRDTPLMAAIQNDAQGTVKILLENGADPIRVNAAKKSPLEVANDSYKTEIAALIKAKLNPTNENLKSYPLDPSAKARGECDIADAAKRQMEVHGKLQAQVDQGKMSSEIFRTFGDDTKELSHLLVEDPTATCRLLDQLAKKYGVE